MRCFTGHNHLPRCAVSPVGPSYPEGNFRGNQLLGGSIGLSPLCHSQATRFARQNSYHLPPQFPMASVWNGIVHHLSGPMDLASTQNPVRWTTGPVIPCSAVAMHIRDGCCFHRAPERLWRARQPLASSIDSLVRVSRRAVDGAGTPRGGMSPSPSLPSAPSPDWRISDPG